VGRAELRLRGRIAVAGAPPLSGWARRPARAPDADAEVIDAEFEVVDRADEGGN
jgi:hypothetical protein